MSTIIPYMFPMGIVLISASLFLSFTIIVILTPTNAIRINSYKVSVKELQKNYNEYLFYNSTVKIRARLEKKLSEIEEERKIELICDNLSNIEIQYKRIHLPFRLVVRKEHNVCIKTYKNIKK